jgi:peptidoglycan/LPS O-acetylase OafA/YrhL
LVLLATAYLVNEASGAWLITHVFAYTSIAVACLFLLIAIIGAEGIARNPIFVHLGRISYGLYIFHEPALLIGHRLAPALTVPLGTSMTITMAMVSYRWFETPFLRLKDRFALIPSRPL